MKNQVKNIVVPIVATIIGVLIGYVLFNSYTGKENNTTEQKEEQMWTCPMHPQIQKPEPGNCPICGMELVPMENSGGAQQTFTMTEEAKRMAQVQTIIVGDSVNNTNGLKLSGKIQTDETNAASIVSHIPGRIEKLYVRFTGEKIRKGQKIASIYSPNLITAQKELIEAHKMKDVNPKLYEASFNKLRYWKIKESQIETILATQEIQESFDIYADHSGVVLKKNVNVGDHLMEGEILFSVQNLNQLWGVFDVYESDLQKISEGDPVTFSTPAYPEETFSSTVEFIDPVIHPETRTAEVRIAINNRSKRFKPEMFIEGHLSNVEKSSNKTIMIPASAVLWTGKRSVVFEQIPNKEEPTYQYRNVQIGEKVGEQYPVLSGLTGGEEIVVNGNFMLDATAQLKNAKSMMNQND